MQQRTSREAGSFTELEVIDYGIGIPENLLKKLFSSTADTSRTGTEGELGTGFGMPIVKAAVEACQGHIQVQSSTEKTQNKRRGTTFIVSLPSSQTNSDIIANKLLAAS